MDEELLADFDSFTTPQETPIMETQPMEEPMAVEPTAETPTITEPTMETPTIVAPEADQMLSDFDTFTQPQVDPIEKHRPQNIDDNSWMDIKERVSKFLGEYTPVAAIPKMAAEFMGEAQQKEGSQIAEAMSVKSRLENIDFAYSDLADTFKSATGDKASVEVLKTKQNKLNDEVVVILDERGIEAFNDNGKLMVVTKDEDGNDVLNDLDDEVLESVLGGFKASAGEIGGAIIGAAGGATMAQRTLPPTAPLPARATAGVVGAAIGGYTGATAGRATDLIRNAVSLNKEIDAREVLEKSLVAGTADVAGTAVIGLAAKGASKAFAPLGKVTDRLKTLFKEGDIQGAKRVVKEDYGLTDQNIDTLFEGVKKDIEGLEDLTGDDLLRAKLTAAIQQQPQGKALITSAIRNNAKAAIETSKEIDFRAKQVMQSANQFSKKPSKIKKSIEAYEKTVGKNYSEVRGLIDEALPNYKYSLKAEDFDTTLRDLETRVIDPLVKDKMTNLINVVSQKMDGNVADLIDLRQMVNKFYSKNQSAFELKPDKEALFNIQKTIDGKLDEAINSVDGGIISSQLKGAFKDAKAKYAKMFKTQDTASYNAIFRKGASEDDIGKALIKYSKATDGDLESVLGKLSPVQRTKSEFSILKQMVDSATAKGEAKAVDFTALLEDVGTSKAIFKTPEAKQFLKNIESYDKKFGKDIDIQKIAAGVAPKVEKNIATSMAGKILMKISALRFEALQRMIPTETGRRLSLQKSIESALEKSRTPREFFFEASKIKGMPNKERISLKKAIKEIGEKEELLKKQMVDQQEKNRKAVADAQIKKQQMESKKVLSEQEFKKAKWEKAKEASKKQKLSEQAQKVKDASEVPIGGSEDMAKKEVKNVFAKDLSDEAKYKGMSKADIKELERIEADEANKIFAKFGDNLAAGTIAGVEEDDKGNISFSPEKFVAGLGGYTALKTIAKSPTVRKELKGYFERMFDDLESNQKYNLLVGKQSIVSDRLTKVTKKHFPDVDIKDLDKDDILYFNKASRMLDNMDIQARKEGIEEVPYPKDRTNEQIVHDLFYDVAEIEKEMGERSMLETGKELPSQAEKALKKGDVVRAEYDPSIVPYEKAVQKKIKPEIDKTTRDANFKKWFGDSKVVDYDGEPLVVYHGTTHDFGEFTMDRANADNWHGKGFYFSDSLDDVNRNYGTTEGADLTNRIEQLKERYADEIGDDFPDLSGDEVYAKAEQKAKDELSGDAPSVMPAYLNTKNPVEIKENGGTEFEIRMFDDEGEYLYDLEGDGAELIESVRNNISNFDYEAGDSIASSLYEVLSEQETFNAKQFEDILRNIEEFGYLEGDEGESISHQILSDVYKDMGFDGIILRDADQQFQNMGMAEDTTHYILFESNQVKSINNSGAFSKDGNILKGALTVPVIGLTGAENALSQKESN